MGVWVWVWVGRAGHSDICSLTVKSRCLTLENTQRDHSLLRDGSVVLLFFISEVSLLGPTLLLQPTQERSVRSKKEEHEQITESEQ